MKRIFAKLLSFLLMSVITAAVVCSLSANFPAVYKITGIKGICSNDGGWMLYTNRTESGNENVVTQIPGAGKIAESIVKPRGFLLCIAMYFILLFIGRKKKTPQRTDLSAAYNKFYCESCESEDEISEEETETSVPETSPSVSSYK